MANASVAQSISRQTVAAALRQARIDAQEHRDWINAINRAALNLEACSWAFDGEVLQIASATSNARYTVDRHGCECKAGQAGRPCWHRAACRLLVKAAEIGQQPPLSGVQQGVLQQLEQGTQLRRVPYGWRLEGPRVPNGGWDVWPATVNSLVSWGLLRFTSPDKTTVELVDRDPGLGEKMTEYLKELDARSSLL